MARAGRKRKAGSREANGQLQRGQKDVDTAQRKTLRKNLMGWRSAYDEDRKSGKDTDVPDYESLSLDFPLDILRGHRKITGAMHCAGQRFGQLHGRAIRSPHPAGASWANLVKPEQHPEAEPPRARIVTDPNHDAMLDEANYAVMIAALDKLPNHEVVRAVMRDLAIYFKRDWYVLDILNHQKTGNAHIRRTALIRMALQALADADRVRLDDDETIVNALRVRTNGEPTPKVA